MTSKNYTKEELFEVPELDHLGTCPLCLQSYGFDPDEDGDNKEFLATLPCCSTPLCRTCCYSHGITCAKEGRPASCPFCREPYNNKKSKMNVSEYKMALREKIDKRQGKDTHALRELANLYLNDDKETAFVYHKKAVQLGNVSSMYDVSVMLRNGWGVTKDKLASKQYSLMASVAGHPNARAATGVTEIKEGNIEQGAKHLEIASAQGSTYAIDMLKKLYKNRCYSKSRLENALRAHFHRREQLRELKKSREETEKRITEGWSVFNMHGYRVIAKN